MELRLKALHGRVSTLQVLFNLVPSYARDNDERSGKGCRGVLLSRLLSLLSRAGRLTLIMMNVGEIYVV
eukprot:2478699-Amphidinium_carterae.1